MAIKFYKTNDPHGFLNNFTHAPMFIFGRWWADVEHAFQAAKTLIKEEQDLIWKSDTPRKAKDLGQKVTLRPDWENIKVNVMKKCVLAKFLQNHNLRFQLMQTGDEELIEDSPVDWFWGIGKDGVGKNMLGKVLMEVRKELKSE